MMIYIVGIGFFILVIIVSIILFFYFKKDETKPAEVTNSLLLKLGKKYSKNSFEEVMFDFYSNIILNLSYEDYISLKDSVSDDVYNQFLLRLKELRDKKERNYKQDIKKEFCKLVDFSVKDDLEVVRLWVRYSLIDYTTTVKESVDASGNLLKEDVVVRGSKNKPINFEYIITFVKNKNSEDIVCPQCGNSVDIITRSNCIKCGNEILPKKMHWVYTGNTEVRIEL